MSQPSCPPGNWTDEEKEKLLRLQQQSELFDEVEEGKQIRLLEKLPYDFHYRYECEVDGQTFAYRHKLVDWEIGILPESQSPADSRRGGLIPAFNIDGIAGGLADAFHLEQTMAQ